MPDFHAVAVAAAKRNGIDPNIFLRQIQQESGFNPNARSSAGAIGIAQIVPKWHPDVDATDPVASLNYAAHLMGTLYRQYGDYAQALSVYNSGKPNAYKDPNFSGGQTYHYVKTILGGSNPPAGQNRGAVSPPPGLPGDAPGLPSPLGVTSALRQSLHATDQLLGIPPTPFTLPTAPTLRLSTPVPSGSAPSVPTGPKPLRLVYVPAALGQRAGIQVSAQILGSVESVAKQFGVRVSSGYRSPAHNAAIGGAKNSDHLRGDAVDFVGTPAQVTALYRWAQGRFPYVEPMSQAHDHVHISFIR